MNSNSPSTLFDYFHTSELFQDVNSELFDSIASEITLVKLLEGETLYQQDTRGDSLALLIEGRLAIKLIHPDGSATLLSEMAPGEIVGISGLLIGHKRSASVVASQDSTLLCLTKAGFNHLLLQRPDLRSRFEQIIRPELLNNYLVRAIHNLLPDLDLVTLDKLQSHLEWLDLYSGEMLFKENDPSDALYFVIYGRLCYAHQAALEKPLGEVEAGECVGEMGLITGEPRATSVYAVRDTLLARLDRATFEELSRHYPHLEIQLARLVIQRTRPPSKVPIQPGGARARAAVVIVVAPVSPDVPWEAFICQLEDALASLGATNRLTPERIVENFGRVDILQSPMDGVDSLCFQAWLSNQEQLSNYVLYHADPSLTPEGELTSWTQRCIRQADLILLVGQAGHDPALSPLEQAIQQVTPRARTELVLIQPDSLDHPHGTHRWLQPRQVRFHHHVRLSRQDDFQHLARYLAGRGVGLVLGGGAARGFAHVGVYRALREHGFQIDFIGGTSIGAILGAMYASQMDEQAVYDVVSNVSSLGKLFDPTLPAVSFFSSNKITEVLKHIFGEADIEDLWRPFYCISSNLTRAAPVVHRSGRLWEAVRASSAIPGAYSPVVYDGDLLVDGAVLNNLPVDVMYQMVRGGLIIAVNVIPEIDMDQKYDFGPSVSGWEQILGWLNPLSHTPPAPWIFESLMRVVALNDVIAARGKRWMADIYIAPPVERYNMLDFSAYKPIIEIGYQAAQQAITEWEQRSGIAQPAPRPLDTLQNTLNDLDALLNSLRG
jgi:predicted acylesterase/phospholipase RssA/CRP-like cAMP-binding protein